MVAPKLWKFYKTYCATSEEMEEEPLPFDDFAATIIQNWWYDIRRKIRKMRRQLEEAEKLKRLQERRENLKPEVAVKIIQRAWRRHIDCQVFQYYKDAINFRYQGDPKKMLKCVNPREAALLDAAGGFHIKFRLAGDTFPPRIYYKIFTHNPVIDMCANSPKDYTKASVKKPEANLIHNKHLPFALPLHHVLAENQQRWYQRVENNGWRPVSDRLLFRLDGDEIQWESSQKKTYAHHNRLRKKQDLLRSKKRRKVEWLRKMYGMGLMQPKQEVAARAGDLRGQVQRAVEGIIRTAEEKGPDAVEEWEVDELLDWTTSLNFDDYFHFWKAVGTSDVSEMEAVMRTHSDKDLSGGVSAYDPYGLTFSRTDRERGTASQGDITNEDIMTNDANQVLSPSPERGTLETSTSDSADME